VELIKPVLQIVGYQNSGKTTLVMKIIEALIAKDMRVGTIKHHGHGGFPNSYEGDKDTARHRFAGAQVTAVEGAGMLQIHALNAHGWALHDLLSFYINLPIDIILIEGYKYENFPKIVLLRSEDDEKLLEQMENVQAVIYWYNSRKITKMGIPAFQISDEMDYLNWITTYLKG